MFGLPKLRVKRPFGEAGEDIFDLEEAEYRFSPESSQEVLVIVEGQIVNSYEELVQLASRDDYRDREFLDVELIPALVGGG